MLFFRLSGCEYGMRETWEVFLCTFRLRGRLKLAEIRVQNFSENLTSNQ